MKIFSTFAITGSFQIECMYAHAIKDQLNEVQEVRRHETMTIPSNIDYNK